MQIDHNALIQNGKPLRGAFGPVSAITAFMEPVGNKVQMLSPYTTEALLRETFGQKAADLYGRMLNICQSDATPVSNVVRLTARTNASKSPVFTPSGGAAA